MKETLMTILGTLLVAAVAFLFLSNIQQSFAPFEYAVFPIGDSLVSTEEEVAQGVRHALWDLRSLDIILLALLLFVSSACCASILGSERAAERRE